MTNIISAITYFFKNFITLLLFSFAVVHISGTVLAGTLPDGLYAQMKTSKGEIVLKSGKTLLQEKATKRDFTMV